MPNVGPLELLIAGVVALLILGPKKLPEAARSLGSGIRGFKDSLTGGPQDAAAPTDPSATGDTRSTRT